jgi:MinD superfamily P-loop ATPase containing an inserted ferredoxin domain
MIRKIIQIDAQKCNGCGLCAKACHEAAISMVDGKAVLIRDDYCDGLGDCLPICPTEAITFVEREALEYNEAEVKRNIEKKKAKKQLNQWPLQIKLVPLQAPYFHEANLLIAADCTAYAYANFYEDFIKGKTTLIGCPKLDEGDYAEKLTEILSQNSIKSVTVVRMEVPCCSGIENAVMRALQNCKKMIQWQVVIISTNGRIIN